MTAAHYLRCLWGIVIREALRFVHQRGRFVAALIRPLVWLFIFAAGFRSANQAPRERPSMKAASTRLIA